GPPRPASRRLSRGAPDLRTHGRRRRRAACRHRAAYQGTRRMSTRADGEGLEGIVAAKTELSHSDGEQGIVWVRGHTIDDLVAHHGYEGTVALLWDGFAGTGLTREAIVHQLGAARTLVFARLDDWLPAAAKRLPIEALRLALAALPDAST